MIMQMTKKTIPTAAAIVNCQLEAWTLQSAQFFQAEDGIRDA